MTMSTVAKTVSIEVAPALREMDLAIVPVAAAADGILYGVAEMNRRRIAAVADGILYGALEMNRRTVAVSDGILYGASEMNLRTVKAVG